MSNATEWPESRADAIGQNGNDGSHYATWWTAKNCTKCGRQTAAKVSNDAPMCPECVTCDEVVYATPSKASSVKPHKYQREIKPGVWVDVYDVLAAWAVDNPALQHLIKKALQPGERGHKTREQDMADILASAKRAQELEQ